MGWVVVEEVGVVANAIAVTVGRFGPVQWEIVGVVAHAVVVRVGRFAGVVRECILSVENPVAVRVHIADEHFVAEHRGPEFKSVMRRDLDLPFLAGLRVGRLDGGLAVVSRLVRAVNVPVERGLP